MGPRKPTSKPTTRVQTQPRKQGPSSLLDSSYQMDENKPSYRTTSYRMDEVQPT